MTNPVPPAEQDTPAAPRDVRSQSLLPREHGIYAEVAFPLVTALALGNGSPSGFLLAVSVVAAFLLHEPIVVLLGRRGGRAKRSLGPQAKKWVVILAAIALACGSAGVWRATAAVRVTFVLLVPVAVVFGLLVVTRREKTFLGEGFIALVLCFASVPIALACGVPFGASLAAAVVWAAAFLQSTATVHAVLARSKRGTTVPAMLVAATALILLASVTSVVLLGGSRWLLAFGPVALICFGVVVTGLRAKQLRTVGWSFVFGDLVTAAILLATISRNLD